MMIRAEHLGHIVRIVDVDGKVWKGKAVELEGPEESTSGEVEIGINFAGGITMFAEGEIAKLRIMDDDITPGNSKQASEMLYHQFDEVKLKDGRQGTIVDTMGPDYVVDVGEDESEFDTIIVKPEEIEDLA
ncbi:MAG: hypothetical protein PUE12_16755 [Oscillospiraceae bacterium]|nr:hypothetical protein [Oscillospiraceae bacterium]